jgi:co-chaperonin GroES (HSP10)
MIPKLEDCAPGLRPTGYNVLVAVDVVEEKTAGGIILPGKHTERETAAAERGRLVEASPMAFKGGDWGDCDAPPIGAEVLFQRYAGSEFEGRDGRKYRVMADTDLKGVFA